MTYDDLVRQLRNRLALIVHFSHHANMRTGGVFPADLYAAALNSRLWALSCCLVWPKHRMALPGSVGIVLHPRSLASIVGVKAGDAAYSTQLDGSESGMGDDLNQESFNRSFNAPPGEYNEWRVRESDVVGIYWEQIDGVAYAKKATTLTDPDSGAPIGQDITMQPVTADEIHAAFPDLPVYTRTNDGRILATNIPGSALYPWSMATKASRT